MIVEGKHRLVPFNEMDRIKNLPKAVAEGKSLPEVIRLTAEGESTRKAS